MWLRGSISLLLILASSWRGRCFHFHQDSRPLSGYNTSDCWHVFVEPLRVGSRKGLTGISASRHEESSGVDLEVLDNSDIDKTLNLPQNIWPMRKDFVRGSIERQIRIQKFWKDNDVYRQLLERRLSIFDSKQLTDAKATKSTRVILDGPPYANGDAHYGHFLNKTIKDILLKAALLEGKLALFLPGWDCHGIPIEGRVISATDHALGDLRTGVSEAGVPRAVEVRQRCSQVAFRSIQSQTAAFERAGIWGLWKDFYATYHFYYEKKVMDSFKELYDRELIYRARCPQHYSTMSKSVIADSELVSEERDILTTLVSFQINDPTAVLRALDFHRPLGAVMLVCWTTLPWTIPANRGILLNGDVDYNVFYRDGILYIMNNNEEFDVFQPKHHIGKVRGDTLVGLTILNPVTGYEYKVYDHAGILDGKGTGIVHAAPAHGLVDFRMLSAERDFTVHDTFVKDPNAICNIIDENEHYYHGLHTLLDGTSIHDLDAAKMENLLGSNLLQSRIERHPVDVDWRYGNRPHVRITKQWCLSLRERNLCLEQLAKIKMFPESSRHCLYNIIKQRAQDWCISRQRIWGTPIPVTFVDAAALENEEIMKLCTMDDRCEGLKTGEYRVSVDVESLPNYELGDRVFRKLNYMTDTVDVWFESALAQRVTMDRLREILQEMSKRCARRSNFTFRDLVPAYAVEGQDQFRGWYQSSLLLNTLLSGNFPSFARRVITHGFVNDNSGHKLSKRNQAVDTESRTNTTLKTSDVNINHAADEVDGGKRHCTLASQRSSLGNVSEDDKQAPQLEKKPGDESGSDAAKSSYTNLMTMLGVDYYDDIELLDLDAPKCVGADVLRLWVCSNDFLQRDIQLNPTNLREARDFAKKVANFFKYTIGVTHDCRLANNVCKSRLSNFTSLDIHFLKLSFELVVEARRFFREGRFHMVVRALDVFLTQFSNVYISYNKDTLYCDVKYGYKRTSVQAIIRQIMRNVLGVVAPLMPHMAEDVFQVTSHAGSQEVKKRDRHQIQSVFGLRWRKMPSYLERVDVSGVERALQLRNLVNSFNVKTADQVVVIVCDDDEALRSMLELETKHGLDLRLLLNVGEVKLRLEPLKNMGDKLVKRGNGYSIFLEPSYFDKCKRCWLYRESISNGLCERCSDICSLKPPEEAPQSQYVMDDTFSGDHESVPQTVVDGPPSILLEDSSTHSTSDDMDDIDDTPDPNGLNLKFNLDGTDKLLDDAN
ncbi:tRNA synthetases class I protein superfamily [Babesia divergens]|uniref:isoleucine--tRNA ligase n=1 Tax=Babesia divergens TaxID=32595 RepID=A0AAD9LK55_BABDI|nr:tRNA synthetases class I protein superfamily [Babesia divergens]